jgi:hypothetical protein
MCCLEGFNTLVLKCVFTATEFSVLQNAHAQNLYSFSQAFIRGRFLCHTSSCKTKVKYFGVCQTKRLSSCHTCSFQSLTLDGQATPKRPLICSYVWAFISRAILAKQIAIFQSTVRIVTHLKGIDEGNFCQLRKIRFCKYTRAYSIPSPPQGFSVHGNLLTGNYTG